ncbi:MAG: 3-oxoacyl-ACP reductase FabG [Bacillota bacterium]
MRLKDKVAIITGSGKGIGEAIARRFAMEGAKIVICDLNESDVERVKADLEATGCDVLGIVADITQRKQVENMVNMVMLKYGTIDVLVNNAGITKDVMFHKMNESEWDDVLKVNLKGCFHCSQAVVGTMREKGYGKIINISSTSRFGNVGQTNYAASKAGLVGLTRSLAKELGPKGINVNAVAPGTINTDMFMEVPENIRQMALYIIPLKRFGAVEEVANVCLFLASDESSYITGQVIHCDGGMFMP